MSDYVFTEHGRGYKIGKTLRSFRPQFPIIVSWVPARSKVLDIGCGDGVLGQKLITEKKCRVYGLDLDPIGVKEAQRKGMQAKVFDFDNPLPHKRDAFDVVIASDILQYSKYPNTSVREWLRVGKTLIIYFPNFGFWFYRLHMLLGRFPSLSLYGHTWYNTRQTRFFTLADFLALPAIKNAKINKLANIDWRNRNVSILAKYNPNFFARSCLMYLKKT